MMRKFLAILLLTSGTSLYAQNVGIGTTTPDANAILDLSSGTKGFLMPRVSDANMNAMPSPLPGMMLYNTSQSRPYLYIGTWKKLMLDGDPFSLPYTGAGNTTSTLFSVTQNGLGPAATAIFGYNLQNGRGVAGFSENGEGVSGTSNTGTGGYFSATSGKALVGAGDVWLNKTSGKTMIGNLSAAQMQLHISDAADTALLLLDNNAALANNSNIGMYFKNGSWYTGAIKTIGTGTNVARLGFYTFAASNQNGLQERLSILDNGNIGVGNNNPANKLDVSGTFRATGNAVIGGTLQIQGGSPGDGKVLTSDASGVSGWSGPVGFMAYNSSGTTVNFPANTGLILFFNTENFDQSPNASGYVPATGSYTIPVTGLYQISTSVAVTPTAANQHVELDIQLVPNGITYEAYGVVSNTVSGKQSISNSITLSLTAGQSIRVLFTNLSASSVSLTTNAPGVTGYPAFFSASLVR
jgi:hypothetical protein